MGATVVLVLTGGFLAAWLLAPRHGALTRLVRTASLRLKIVLKNGEVCSHPAKGHP